MVVSHHIGQKYGYIYVPSLSHPIDDAWPLSHLPGWVSLVVACVCAYVCFFGARQANFFVPLAEKYPEQAMSRFESGQFPINAASKMAYVKAASALGRTDQVDIQASGKRNSGGC